MDTTNDKLLLVIEQQKNVVKIIREVSSKVNTSLDLQTIFESTFQLLDRYFQFKHIMILLVDKKVSGQLAVTASHGYNGEGIGATVPIGKGVIGMVAKNKKLLRMSNIQQNLQYIKVALEQNQSRIKLPGIPYCASQLAVPLLNHEDLVGVISIENPAVGLFDKKDEELLQMIGVQIGIAINNAKQFNIIETTNAKLQDLNENLESKVVERTKKLARQKQQIEDQHALLEEQHWYLEEEQNKTQKLLSQIEKLFGQQVSIEVAKELVTSKGETKSKSYEVTVMFLDIRDFTVFADSKAPEEVAAFQNIVFGELLNIVRKYKGITNQILGDGIMAVFGAPVKSDRHIQNAVTAGYSILDKIKELATEDKIPPIRLGIGLHSGKVIAGNIGNAFRKQYSLTGSTVIIASRIEQLNKVYNSQFLVSEEVQREIKNTDYQATELGNVELKGIEQAVCIYKLA
ncbi:MAG: GAF domain-containing protein [Cyclobacteriaceae bacterium]|nr:GAF domain-containing protein [Cyclobacteriaceae bacterium]MCK5372556.1 GAF domain-containing protein [Cyclobacteriaceae bacterium]MCK5469054.1 GAF domain-containing protein [Cyclobacteriaceae bacterium]